jgi:hypothetical protein
MWYSPPQQCFSPTRPVILRAGGNALLLALLAITVPRLPGADAASFGTDLKPLLENLCYACHDARKHKAGIDLSAYHDESAVHKDVATWRKVANQIDSRDMPPEDATVQPSDAQRQLLVSWIRTSEARALVGMPRDPGASPPRRLNRAEYAATMQDLLGAGADLGEVIGLPDDSLRGFSTFSGSLGMPPLLFEKYYAAADLALARLVEPPAGAKAAERAAWDAVFIAPPGATPASRHEAARIILQAMARRAYRRPVQPDELARLLRLYDAAAQNRDFVPALKLALKAMLVSPNFLYRLEQDRAKSGVSDAYPIDSHELAVRLSYLLWSTMPDAELSALADQGRLGEPAVLEAQVRRLLADRRGHAFTAGFFASWLQIDHLEKARPSQMYFPALTPELRAAMYDETALFIDQLREHDGRLLDLLDCDYAFVNADLARLYGLPAVSGTELRRVSLPAASHRGGLLGMASVLTMTSHTFRTSPTLRGKWILEVLLGTPPPPPPANVNQQIDAPGGGAAASHSFREQLAQHVKDPSCAACHRKMDPLGFALDNYDGIGGWRESTAERPLDTSGKLPGGEAFNGAAELKKVLWNRRARFVRTLVEQCFSYALGRDLAPVDETSVQQVIERLDAGSYRFSDLVLGVVTSYPFLNRRNNEPAPRPVAAGAERK